MCINLDYFESYKWLVGLVSLSANVEWPHGWEMCQECFFHLLEHKKTKTQSQLFSVTLSELYMSKSPLMSFSPFNNRDKDVLSAQACGAGFIPWLRHNFPFSPCIPVLCYLSSFSYLSDHQVLPPSVSPAALLHRD